MSSKEQLKIYYNCLIAALILIIGGSAMVLSSSTSFAIQNTGDAFSYFEKHLVFLAVGSCFFLFFQSFNYRRLRKWSKFILIVSFLLLIAVIVVGHRVKGAKRTIGYGSMRFQPSELAKLGLILYLADFFAKKKERIKPKMLIAPLCVLGIMAILLMKEPDFGSTFLIFLYTLSFFFLAGLDWKIIAGCIGSFIPMAAALIYFATYRMHRIMGFLHPENDPHGIGYQISQSLISLGSGGLYGVGIGKGRQKLEFLPEAYKDYVFAIVGEEMGLIGTLCLLILFAMIVSSCFKLAKRLKDPFGKYLVSGIGVYFGFQVALHAGVVVNSLPPKGTTLPFFSFGGSSLIIGMVTLGIFFNIIRSLSEQKEDVVLER